MKEFVKKEQKKIIHLKFLFSFNSDYFKHENTTQKTLLLIWNLGSRSQNTAS